MKITTHVENDKTDSCKKGVIKVLQNQTFASICHEKLQTLTSPWKIGGFFAKTKTRDDLVVVPIKLRDNLNFKLRQPAVSSTNSLTWYVHTDSILSLLSYFAYFFTYRNKKRHRMSLEKQT